MKTPDEIKKGLECCTPGWVANHWKSCSSKCPYITLSESCRGQLVYDSLTYIQQLENHIGELTEKVAQLEAAQPKWISVEERLPENDDNYLVFTSDKNEAEIATYYGDGEWLTHDLTNLTRLVTHWAPLPSMPDPQKEKE